MNSLRVMPEEEKKRLQQLANKRRRVEGWLLKNHTLINFTAIEKQIDAPKGLVQKFVKYNKKINDKWIEPLYIVIRDIASLR